MITQQPRKMLALSIIAVLILRLVLMASFPLLDTSEPRYAEIARIMAQSGDWITPWFEPGVPFWGKPPLAFWMSALSLKLFGDSDFAVRLPSFLATLATMYLIHRHASRQFNRQTADWAMLVYLTSALPFLAAGAMLTDAFLTLSMTLSLVAFSMHRAGSGAAWGYLFFIGLALGMLSKGPLAPVLVVAVIGLWMVAVKAPLSSLRTLPWATGILSFLALTAPWYVLAELKTPGFLRYFIIGEHLSRFLDPGWQGDLYGSAHQRVHGSIWLDWFLATFPWGLVAGWHLVRAGCSRKSQLAATVKDVSPLTVFLVLWALITPLFFTFSGNILWTYVQPSLPAFAILFAADMQRRRGVQAAPPRAGTLILVVPLAALALGILASLYPEQLRTEQGLIQYHRDHAQASQPLCYLDSRPFSARYYSKGTIDTCRRPDLPDWLALHPSGVYMAVRADQQDTLQGFIVSPVLFRNRNHALVFVRAPTRDAPDARNGRK